MVHNLSQKNSKNFVKPMIYYMKRIPVRLPEINPNIKRFFKTLKEEFVELHEFIGYGLFFKKLDEFMKEYN